MNGNEESYLLVLNLLKILHCVQNDSKRKVVLIYSGLIFCITLTDELMGNELSSRRFTEVRNTPRGCHREWSRRIFTGLVPIFQSFFDRHIRHLFHYFISLQVRMNTING